MEVKEVDYVVTPHKSRRLDRHADLDFDNHESRVNSSRPAFGPGSGDSYFEGVRATLHEGMLEGFKELFCVLSASLREESAKQVSDLFSSFRGSQAIWPPVSHRPVSAALGVAPPEIEPVVQQADEDVHLEE